MKAEANNLANILLVLSSGHTSNRSTVFYMLQRKKLLRKSRLASGYASSKDFKRFTNVSRSLLSLVRASKSKLMLVSSYDVPRAISLPYSYNTHLPSLRPNMLIELKMNC